MDLWTAIRGTARQELENLSKRLGQLGAWDKGIPSDKLSLEDAPPIARPPERPPRNQSATGPKMGSWLASGKWTCECRLEHLPSDNFCDECGKPPARSAA